MTIFLICMIPVSGLAKVKQLVVWECTIRRMMKDKAIEQSVITSIISFLEGVEDFTEI